MASGGRYMVASAGRRFFARGVPRVSPSILSLRFTSGAATAARENVLDAEVSADHPSTAKEVSVGAAETIQFQAETKKLLDIVARSLYTEREVFIREIVSNASDALEKLRHMRADGKETSDPDLPLEIQISTDDARKVITIADTGIGMTRDELVANLGTIARSGTSEFLEKLRSATNPSSSNLIGQFGVGFYSIFMVGSQVTVYSKSALPGAKGYCWKSDGTGVYSIAEAEGVARGTKIVIELKKGGDEFAKARHVEAILKKHSNFVSFPITLNGTRVNTIRPLWTLPKGSISDAEHKEFYQFLAHAYDEPLSRLHFSSELPLSVQSLFYVPEQHSEKYGMGRMEPGVNLFCRKVLIQAKARGLLPDWLRFIKGVVDCEDLSLNLSREHLQDSEIIARLNNLVTGRLLRHFQDLAESDPETYEMFWNEYQAFIKEGVSTDFKWKDELAKLLRCESSSTEAGKHVSLDEYVARMPEEQKEIYYLCVPNRVHAETSPYFESFRKAGIEVLFFYTAVDDFVMNSLSEYRGHKLLSAENARPPSQKGEVKSDTSDAKAKAASSPKDAAHDSAESMDPKELEDLLKWMKTILNDRVSSVRETTRLHESPAIIVDHESASFRRMMQMVDPSRAPALPKQRLEVNPNHLIIRGIHRLRGSNPELAKMLSDQIFDDALITAGLMDDARSVVPRVNNLMSLLVSKLE